MLRKLFKKLADYFELTMHRYRNRCRRRQKEKDKKYNHIYPMW